MPSYRADEPPRWCRTPEIERDFGPVRAEARAAWSKGEALAAAGDLSAALAWLGRAHRIAPSDQNLSFSLACLRLRAGDAAGAARLFAQMARFDVRECWTGLALALLQLGRIAEAANAVQKGLQAHAVDSGIAAVAARIVQAAGLPGWCGVQHDGVLLMQFKNEPHILMDGEAVLLPKHPDGLRRLPSHWRQARHLTVQMGATALLGSPIDLGALTRVEGFAERVDLGIAGWAWQSAAPEAEPVLHIAVEGGAQSRREQSIVVSTLLSEVEGTVPLARPRAFFVPAGPGDDVQVTDAGGRHLLGSPLRAAPPEARLETAAACPAHAADAGLPIDVIVPVYRGLSTTLDCLASVIATVQAPDRILVVDDASPEPELVAALDDLAASGAITLLRTGSGQANGFPAAVNAGLRAASGRHVVLLNSDTLVPPGWLHSLRDAACSAPDIGTATPLSNEASIFSYPRSVGGNRAPDGEGTRVLASLAAEVNGGRLVDVPTAHGFCMFIRHDCLDATGLFDALTFAQGYGEENDFCERAAALGFRHVAVPGVFVTHVGGVSFGPARTHLLRRNLGLLNRRYPGYAARVEAFIAADLLAPARRRLDAARWASRARDIGTLETVLLVTHGGGGGTTRVVGERAQALRAQGRHPVVLRAVEGRCEVGEPEGDTPNLVYALPAELGPLRRLLAAGRPVAAELHHLLGHDHSVLRLFAALRIPYDVWVHDYGWFCARLSFVTGEGRFCGEAPASVCRSCIAKWGRGIDDPVSPAILRSRSAADMRRARAVVVPSADVARRVARHVPGLVPQIVSWEAPPMPRSAAVLPGEGARRVAVVGAIGLEKGYDTLLDCARDAAARALALEFVVVGYTTGDKALLATGKAFVTGEFSREEAGDLIRAQRAQLAFLPSIWPETWCYALSDIWSAGLSAAVFDIGTPAARVRESGTGWVLPLGLPAPRINDVLLHLR